MQNTPTLHTLQDLLALSNQGLAAALQKASPNKGSLCLSFCHLRDCSEIGFTVKIVASTALEFGRSDAAPAVLKAARAFLAYCATLSTLYGKNEKFALYARQDCAEEVNLDDDTLDDWGNLLSLAVDGELPLATATASLETPAPEDEKVSLLFMFLTEEDAALAAKAIDYLEKNHATAEEAFETVERD